MPPWRRSSPPSTTGSGGYDPALYTTERVFATAEDGTDVPISLVYRTEFFDRGTNPIYLTGYGSYGASMDPWFSSHRLSLLDRGFVCAIAQVRGGGEMGEAWKDGGRLLNKRNTFTDFIACAEHLVAEGYGAAGKVAVRGTSAGGLLIGAALNMRPELFAVALADVPFVDVLNTMLDASIPLTVGEYDEWGDPSEREYYEYIKSYSPYDNVTRQDYPDILIGCVGGGSNFAGLFLPFLKDKLDGTKPDLRVINVMTKPTGSGSITWPSITASSFSHCCGVILWLCPFARSEQL